MLIGFSFTESPGKVLVVLSRTRFSLTSIRLFDVMQHQCTRYVCILIFVTYCFDQISSAAIESGVKPATLTPCYRKIPGSARRLLWTAVRKPSKLQFLITSMHSKKSLFHTATGPSKQLRSIGSSTQIRCVTFY